jgi:hypothetical protein
MTAHCDLADACARHEHDAGKHLLFRIYADFGQEVIGKPDHTPTCPFFIEARRARDGALNAGRFRQVIETRPAQPPVRRCVEE